MTADKLPLLIHFDSDAWQITKVFVHVICEGFSGFADDALDSVLARFEHTSASAYRRPFAECREDVSLFVFRESSIVHKFVFDYLKEYI